MEQITIKDADLVGGSGLLGWAARQLIMPSVEYISGLVTSGQIDYTGLAEQQGSYYNTVGA